MELVLVVVGAVAALAFVVAWVEQSPARLRDSGHSGGYMVPRELGDVAARLEMERAAYVAGRIDVVEFERQVERVLSGQMGKPDARRAEMMRRYADPRDRENVYALWLTKQSVAGRKGIGYAQSAGFTSGVISRPSRGYAQFMTNRCDDA
jgi:hypothetical protein